MPKLGDDIERFVFASNINCAQFSKATGRADVSFQLFSFSDTHLFRFRIHTRSIYEVVYLQMIFSVYLTASLAVVVAFFSQWSVIIRFSKANVMGLEQNPSIPQSRQICTFAQAPKTAGTSGVRGRGDGGEGYFG